MHRLTAQPSMFPISGNTKQIVNLWALCSRSVEDSLCLGREISRTLKAGDVILLEGALGAGKTVLARGIIEGLGAVRFRGSPTFTLVHEYELEQRVFHLDLYRLSAPEIENLGLDEYLSPDSIAIIEWPERGPRFLSDLCPAALRISIRGDRDNSRTISITWWTEDQAK